MLQVSRPWFTFLLKKNYLESGYYRTFPTQVLFFRIRLKSLRRYWYPIYDEAQVTIDHPEQSEGQADI